MNAVWVKQEPVEDYDDVGSSNEWHQIEQEQQRHQMNELPLQLSIKQEPCDEVSLLEADCPIRQEIDADPAKLRPTNVQATCRPIQEEPTGARPTDGVRIKLELIDEDTVSSAKHPPANVQATCQPVGQERTGGTSLPEGTRIKEEPTDEHDDVRSSEPKHPVMIEIEISQNAIQLMAPHKKKTDLSLKGPAAFSIFTQFQCDICTRIFSKKRALSRHIKLHANGNVFHCDICERVFMTKGHLSMHMQIHIGRLEHECLICHKKFALKGGLNLHMVIHTGQGAFQCQICKKSIQTKSSYDVHMAAHAGIRTHKCTICEKAFTKKSHLTRHLLTHFDHRAYHCDLCSKSFALNSNLIRHRWTHTGIKPNFKCENCQKAYSQKSNMLRHMVNCVKDPNATKTEQLLVSHALYPPIVYQCDYCNKCFEKKRYLKMHIINTHLKYLKRKHPKYQCDYCRIILSRPDTLRRHIKLKHPGEYKIPQCHICNEIFNKCNQLKGHMKIHTGIIKHGCQICEKLFSRRANLIRHYTVVHKLPEIFK